MITYLALTLFLLSVAWLLWVFVVFRPRAAAWRNYAALRKYRRRQPLPPMRRNRRAR